LGTVVEVLFVVALLVVELPMVELFVVTVGVVELPGSLFFVSASPQAIANNSANERTMDFMGGSIGDGQV
jgi:hypothetical protein